MTEPATDLSFDRAAYAAPGATNAAPCGSCKRPLTEQYWKWQRLIVCGTCRDGLAATLAKSQSASSFGKAFLRGGGAALGCGIAYAIFVGVTKIQFALATIGIAFVIATVIRKASHGVSGRRFQVLAVALTYVASTMGYAPGIFSALKDSGKQHATTSTASPSAGIRPANAPPAADDSTSADATDKPAADASGPGDTSKKSVGAAEVALAIVFLVGITLAAPFLELTTAPLGVIIILIGLWEAWRRSRGVPLVIEGPFRVAPQEARQAVPPAA